MSFLANGQGCGVSRSNRPEVASHSHYRRRLKLSAPSIRKWLDSVRCPFTELAWPLRNEPPATASPGVTGTTLGGDHPNCEKFRPLGAADSTPRIPVTVLNRPQGFSLFMHSGKIEKLAVQRSLFSRIIRSLRDSAA
jgi:hypothetical protein